MSTINEEHVKSGMEIEHKQSRVLGTKYCVYAKRYKRCI
jgi:hypothetical protein